MATDLQTIDTSVPTDPAKLMTPPETWALSDSQFSSLAWSAEHAAKAFHPAALPRLIDAHDRSLAPVQSDWLQKRLRLLWKSSTPAGSLDATAWLHETGRLLADIPQDILASAIDEAVKGSERGFMPTVGQIRAIAEPRLARRQSHASRLQAVQRFNDAPNVVEPEIPSWARKREETSSESTADILKRVWPTMSKHEPGYTDTSQHMNLDPARECRAPAADDYKRLFGIDIAKPAP